MSDRIDDTRLAALRQAAEAATDGPWEYVEGIIDEYALVEFPKVEGPEHYDASGNDYNDIARRVSTDANARYIAAADPPTVLALLDEVQRLRAALAETERR